MSQSENAQKILVEILLNPKAFDVNQWYVRHSCGSSACLAGHGALLMGWVPVNPYLDPYFTTSTFRNPRTGEHRDVEDLGQEFLALDGAAATMLFMSCTNEEAIRVLDKAAQGAPITTVLVSDVQEEMEMRDGDLETLIQTLRLEYLDTEQLEEIYLREGSKS